MREALEIEEGPLRVEERRGPIRFTSAILTKPERAKPMNGGVDKGAAQKIVENSWRNSRCQLRYFNHANDPNSRALQVRFLFERK